MARIVGLDQGDGPVEPGEQHVIDVLAEGLDDRFTIAPNLQVVHRGGQVDDVDVLVIGPFGVIVIEVKNLAGQVIISEREMYVDGHRRGNPYVQTYAKARRIKSRIADHPQTSRVWVAPLVVLARDPRELRVPDDQRDAFALVDDVVEQLLDPDRWRGSDLSRGERQAALRQLNLVSRPRPDNLSLGPYRLGQLESETNLERRYRATHTVLGTEHEIVHIGYDPARLGSDGGRAAVSGAYREAIALKDVGTHPNVRAATDLFTEPDGSAVLVLPPRTGESLREILTDGPPDENSAAKILWDVISAVAHIHGGDVAHRRICPSTIEVDADGHAVLAGFGFAQIPGQEGGTQHLSLGLPIEEIPFVAPELFRTGTAGLDADLFSIGKLSEELGITELGGVDLGHLAEPEPDDREPSIDELLESPTIEAPAADDSPFDGYQILRRLSESPDGTTELAYNVLSGQQVVIRSYPGIQGIDKARSVFRSMSAGDHPGLEHANTVIRGRGDTVGVVSLFVEGRSLAEAIDTGSLPDDRLGIVREMARAIGSLHDRGWAHGDVTPANVILSDSCPVLIDFGIACPISGVPLGGTPAYRPLPGWLRADTAAGLDLFGLGIVAHEVLHGKRPEITEEGLEVEVDEPWAPAVAAALGLNGAPPCDSIADFLVLLDPEADGDASPADDADDGATAAQPEESEPDDGLYQRIDELIIAGRLDEAEQLCPAEWTNLAERITRAREQKALESEAVGDVLDHVGDVAVFAGAVSRTVLPMTISGERDVRGNVSHFRAHRGDVSARLEVVEADNGETWIVCTDVSGSIDMYNAIVSRLRIGARPFGHGHMTMDLALAAHSDGRWVARPADEPTIRERTGLDIEEILLELGEAEVGARAVLLGDTSPRRSYLCAVFDQRLAVDALVRAFVALRIIPVLEASSLTEVAQSEPEMLELQSYPPDPAFDQSVTFESPTRSIVRRLAEITDYEGPLNFKRLSRSFRVAAGAGRVTAVRRAKLVKALETAQRSGDLEIAGKVSDDETVIKLPEQSWIVARESGNRSLAEIPLSELGAVLDAVSAELPRLGDDALIDHVLREIYGRERVHGSAIHRMRRARGVRVDGGEAGGKYTALARHLASQRGRAVTMSFDEISHLVGGLPPSAYEHQAWWANSRSHTQAGSWMSAGWRVVTVNLNTQSVKFVR